MRSYDIDNGDGCGNPSDFGIFTGDGGTFLADQRSRGDGDGWGCGVSGNGLGDGAGGNPRDAGRWD